MDMPAINTAALTASQAASADASASRQRQAGMAIQRAAGELPANAAPSENLQRRADTREVANPAPPARTLGPVRFEVEEGTRVAKFFDTKDILIYQVPPEGQLYLVKVQQAARDGVATEA